MSYLAVAKEAAEKGGKVAMEYFGKKLAVRAKTGPSDIVTEADAAVEQSIIRTIRQHYPNHRILSEECGFMDGSNDTAWVIDPIDGTLNFASGIPVFGISIAAVEKGKVAAAVIFHPAARELFSAERGQGAFLNGKRIHVSESADLSRGMVFHELKTHYDSETLAQALKTRQRLQGNVAAFRNFGAASYQLTAVARGWLLAYVDDLSYLWDHAAGALIVQEAGGKATDFRGRPWEQCLTGISGKAKSEILASNGLVHGQLVEILKKK